MKTVLLLIIAIVIVAIAAGIIVVHRQGTHPCITYYNKDGSQELYKNCQ